MKSILSAIRKRSGDIVAILIATGVLVAVAVSALTAVCGAAIPLPAGETCAQCIRAWISSLSGWAAAVGALITAGFLLRQISEMRQQNDFLLGRLPVVLQLVRCSDDHEHFTFQLVNRNINQIHIERLETHMDAVWIYPAQDYFAPLLDPNSQGHGHKSWICLGDGIIRGWTDKSERPEFEEFEVKFVDDDGDNYYGTVELVAWYRFIGTDVLQSAECTVDLEFFRDRIP